MDDFKIELGKSAEEAYELGRKMRILPQDTRGAISRAINRTLEMIKTEGVRIARDRYTAKNADISKHTRILKSNKETLQGHVFFSGKKGVPLGDFKATPKINPNWKGVKPKDRKPKLGVSVQIKSTQAGGTFKTRRAPNGEKLFWAWKSGYLRLVYREKGTRSPALRERGRSKTADEDKINQEETTTINLYGPSPIQALMSKESTVRLQKKANEALEKRIQHEMQREIDKLIRSAKA